MMKKVSFLIMLFLLFFSLLNFYILPLIKSINLKESFIVLFTFWAIIILVLYLLSSKLLKDDLAEEEKDDV